MIVGQGHGDLCALAAGADDIQCTAHLLGPLPHSSQTEAIMFFFKFESITIVVKLQAKFICIKAQECFKIARMRILERIGQRFLTDV